MGSIVNRRRYSSSGKKDERLLPYGYFELKWIENTSDAYIDSGIDQDIDNRIYYKCKFTRQNNQNNMLVLGNGDSTDYVSYSFRNTSIYTASNPFLMVNRVSYSFTNTVDNVNIHEIDIDVFNGKGKFDNEEITFTPNWSETALATKRSHILIGTYNQNNKNDPFPGYSLGTIYAVKIYKADVLIGNFIPCLSPDNEVGMYDTVTKTFFKSPNGTAFVAGPKIYDGDDRDAPYDYEVEYLESSGTQWIDTGIKPTNTLSFSCTFDNPNNTGAPDGYGNVFGSRTFSTINEYQLTKYENGSVSVGIRNNNRGFNTSGIHTVAFDGGTTITVNGTTSTITKGTVYSNVGNIVLFGISQGKITTAIQLQAGKIYRCAFGSIRDLIPVVKDGVGCMYDKVSGTFFYNQGTGDFIVGPRVIHCTDNDYYGIRWLATDAPDSPIIRIGNMDWHRTLPIHSKMRRCILGDDGSKRYVSDSDYTKDTDGNAIDYTVSSANGVTYDTAVEMPEHCFLTGTETIDDVDYHYIKLFPKLMIGNFVPTHYMGAFEAMLDRTNNKLYSTVKANIVYNNDGEVDGADLTYAENWRGGNNSSSYDSDSAKTLMGRAVTNITITNFCTYANNRGSYYGITNWAARNNLCRLYAVEYANFDSQTTFNPELNAYGYHQGGLGFGVCSMDSNWTFWSNYNNYNPIMPCGVTLKLGNNTGIVRYNLGTTYGSGATAATYFDVPSYRGIENPFAHLWENATGMYIYGAVSTNYIYVAEDGFHARTFPSNTNNTAPSGYKLRSNSLPLSSGWPVTLDWNDDGDFLAKTLDTTSAQTADNKSVLKDYYIGTGSNGTKCLSVGGDLYNSVRDGLYNVNISDSYGSATQKRGTRLLKVPYYNV